MNDRILANRSLKRTRVAEDLVWAALFFAPFESDSIARQSLIVNGRRQRWLMFQREHPS